MIRAIVVGAVALLLLIWWTFGPWMLLAIALLAGSGVFTLVVFSMLATSAEVDWQERRR